MEMSDRGVKAGVEVSAGGKTRREQSFHRADFSLARELFHEMATNESGPASD
jgi:hypothetical protein